MSHTEMTAIPGHRGATRASYDENNPRTLVKQIVDRYPEAALPEVQRRVKKAIGATANGDASDYLDSFIDWTTANAFASLTNTDRPKDRPARATKKTSHAKPAAQKIAEQAELAATVSSMKQGIKDAWRLEMPAPNGKPLGDCVGMEGAQFTGYFKAVFAGVGPNQKLREVKTGADLAKLQTWKD